MNIEHMVELAEIYAREKSLSLSTVSTYAANDGKWLPRLKAGASCTFRKASVVMDWLSENWPADTKWPADIPRPAPSKKEAA